MIKILYVITRPSKLLFVPFKFLYSHLFPEHYAKLIGVNTNGKFKIYGNSYYTFGAESYLVSIGDNVHISNEVRFITHDGGVLIFRNSNPTLDIVAPITVGNNVSIGLGSTILPDITIGDNVIIGAGSIVTKKIVSGHVVAGNPARVIKSSREYLADSKLKSLEIGHLSGTAKVKAYKKIFNL